MVLPEQNEFLPMVATSLEQDPNTGPIPNAIQVVCIGMLVSCLFSELHCNTKDLCVVNKDGF